MADGADTQLPASIALEANARNNSLHQPLRLARWARVRDELWSLIEPRLPEGGRVALVGAGSCDDVPLVRLAERAASIDLIDFDLESTGRAAARMDDRLRERVRVLEDDVTGGSADLVLTTVRDGSELPDALPLPYDALGAGDYDLVVGDMLYTQLLHAGLIALGVHGEPQHELMRRYDPPLINALVQRIQASLAPGGHAVHVHDVACWASDHTQPIPLDEVLEDPFWRWTKLLRHDACDPHLMLGRLGIDVIDSAWWRWPFEPNKEFLVRGTVVRAGVGSTLGTGTIFR
ncbi:MAG: hypothetical protein JWM86_500 [Thermoleophilia bacterium]|nr:hypothetical protein [Thermoleophilia bacterium]